MRNVIYTIANKKYFPILSNFLYSLRKFNDTPVIVFYDKNDSVESRKQLSKQFNDVSFIGLKDFDANYRSKYSIFNDINIRMSIEKYDNFLYLDCDHVTIRPFDFFCIIENDKSKIHTVIDSSHLGLDNIEHKIQLPMRDFSDDRSYLSKAYNAGCFGFNKALINDIISFLEFVDSNSHLCLTDQPLFNHFFIKNNLLKDSFSDMVYLDCNCENHSQENSNKNLDLISLIHVISSKTREDKFKQMVYIMKQEGQI